MRIDIKSNNPNFDFTEFNLNDPALAPYLGLLAKKTNILFDCQDNKELLILRGHISIEYFLNEVITQSIPKGGCYLVDNLTFYRKLKLVSELDVLQGDLIKFAEEINKIRNKCAHELEYRVTDKDIKKLGSSFPNEYKKIKGLSETNTLFNMLISVLLNFVHDTYQLIKQNKT